jgi:hypothetical protein
MFLISCVTILLLTVQCLRVTFRSESQAVHDETILASVNAYNNAMRFYLNHDYLNAAFGFGLMFERYPDFFLNDKSLFRIGASLLHLGLYDAADSVFKIGYSMHDTTFDSAMPPFGRINVAIVKNRLDSLKILIHDFKQQFPLHRLNGLVSMYDAVAHIRMADTAYA